MFRRPVGAIMIDLALKSELRSVVSRSFKAAQ
jgi:hypothetical protein